MAAAESTPTVEQGRGTREATAAERALVIEYARARAVAAAADAAVAELARQLRVALAEGGHTTLALGASAKVVLVCPAPRSRLDRERLLREHPELVPLVEQYTVREVLPSAHVRVYGVS